MKSELILASTSKYRHQLLSRLGIPFRAMAPLIDEEKEKDPSLSPQALAERLAFLKADSLRAPGRVVIGGDQLVSFQGRILGKSHTRERALKELMQMQGHTHQLITAICIVTETQTIHHTDITRLTMKSRTVEQIEKYLDLDQPYDCAGSYKAESYGISLFSHIESEDFTAIQGLPLLAVSKVLDTLNL